YILQGPVYGLDKSLTDKDLCGFVSNPMEHAEASKAALYGVADYTWNIQDYDPLASWERGLRAVAGEEAAEAYRTFAIHSCDTETGYRRDESWETETFRVGRYTQEQFDALVAEFGRIVSAPGELRSKCADTALVSELEPWLEEFGKLGERGLRTMDLITIYESGDRAAFWAGYVDNLMSQEEKDAYEAHKSGTLKLQPFYQNAMDDMADGFYREVAGRSPYSYTAVGSFSNVGTVLGKLMFDGDSATFYTSGYAQKTGDWIGVDLGLVRGVREIEILQGRNSVDDVDYFDRAVLEASKDGQNWFAVIPDTLQQQYVIHWQGRRIDARYVRLRKLESEKTNWAAVRTFSINPLRADSLGFALQAPDREKAVYAFDNNPFTCYELDGVLSFGIPSGEGSARDLTLLLRPRSELSIRQYAADGTVLDALLTEEPYCELRLSPDAVKVEIEGDTDIFEIL
ncbi:MAG TPA: beta-N-acetylglucosaminidase domain-containing protein, partial [Candidatus Coprenecus stercoravium]|nr:beta-N-acetylglucosaminidase domain-containing protein [Candidatus Coprenecus stercoravium]